MRIALLEDDMDQVVLVENWLSNSGHDCLHFESSQEFLRMVSRESFDLLILDWMLPESSGIEVLKKVRESIDWPIPILFVTIKDSERDIIEALETGADDYMIKPISKGELGARINALIRRASGEFGNKEKQIEIGQFIINLEQHEILVNENRLDITRKEYDLVLFFIRNLGRALSRSYLLEGVWGTTADINTRTIDTHVSRIRGKLNLVPEYGWKLSSIYQYGYRLEYLNPRV